MNDNVTDYPGILAFWVCRMYNPAGCPAKGGMMRSAKALPYLVVSTTVLGCLLYIAHAGRSNTSDVRCISNLQIIQMALTVYVEDNAAYPYVDGGSSAEILDTLFQCDEYPYRDFSHCPRAKREHIKDPGYHIANRPPRDWLLLSQYGYSACAAEDTFGWPLVWCPGAPHNGQSHCIMTHSFSPQKMSGEQIRRTQCYADLLVESDGSIPDLAAAGFFDWGFQERIAPLVKQGLRNLDSARRNSVGMLMLPIPAGTFMMGITADAALRINEEDGAPTQATSNRMPRHEVTLDAFYAAFAPVTVDMWAAYGGTKADDPFAGSRPIRGISWQQASAFCEWLTRRELAAGLISNGCVYRLPTEAEWEWMMLGACNGPYPFGDRHPLEGEEALYPFSGINGYGILAWWLDYEYCLDIYDPSFYKTSSSTNPVCLNIHDRHTPGQRSIRGDLASTYWSKSKRHPYLSNRNAVREDECLENISFRVVLGKPLPSE